MFKLPVAMSAGKITFPAAESTGWQDNTIRFPSGRFTKSPYVIAAFNDTTNVTSYCEPGVVIYNVTEQYAVLRIKRIIASASWDVAWVAVQMNN